MLIKDLNEKQIKELYCAALGWHSQLTDKGSESEKFDNFYEQISFKWDEDRWVIIGKMAQIEITEKLFFRCGMKNNSTGIGGTAFDLKAVFDYLIELKLYKTIEK